MIQAASKAIHQDTIPYDPTITQPDCPVWYRGLVQDPEYEACPLLAKTLAHFKVHFIVSSYARRNVWSLDTLPNSIQVVY